MPSRAKTRARAALSPPPAPTMSAVRFAVFAMTVLSFGGGGGRPGRRAGIARGDAGLEAGAPGLWGGAAQGGAEKARRTWRTTASALSAMGASRVSTARSGASGSS